MAKIKPIDELPELQTLGNDAMLVVSQDGETYKILSGKLGAVQAQQYAQAAYNSATAANEAAQDASASATQASTVLSSSVRYDTAQTLTDNQQAQARENINAAAPDGSYGGMTVGYAEQLTSSIAETDEVPYLYRTAGGNAEIGNYEEDTIIGGSVVWNQIWKPRSTSFSDAGYTITGGENGEWTVTVTVDGTSNTTGNVVYIQHEMIAEHKYILLSDNPSIKSYCARLSPNTSPTIGRCTASANGFNARFYFTELQTGTYKVHPLLTDLTAMFGSTIADYVYNLEQANAGSGIEWLKGHGFFTKDYYPYTEPVMKHVSGLVSHDMVGFNAYDPDTGKAHVVGGMEYQITGAYTALSLNGETITPDTNGKFTPVSDGDLTVTGGNSTTTCVHLCHSGYRNGEYEPYVKHSYPLDSTVTLMGVPKLDASNNLYYYGDTYPSSGEGTTRFNIVDLGTLDWYDVTDVGEYPYFAVSDSSMFWGALQSLVIAAKYDDLGSMGGTAFASLSDTGYSRGVNFNARIFKIRDPSYTTAADFKAALSGTYLVYEKQTPTTFSADPYTNPQIVDDFGTEEYVVTPDSDGFQMPVGHSTDYPVDLKAKLEATANNPQTDGIYLLQYQNGEATYTPLASDTTITDILARLTALENAQTQEG